MPSYGKNGTTFNLEHLQLKFAAASAWTASTVLLAGEVGVESDTHKFKVGDGTTTWGELPYSADPALSGLITALTTRVTTAEGNITALEGRMDTAEADIDAAEARLTTAESDIDAAEGRLDALENITTLSANPFPA